MIEKFLTFLLFIFLLSLIPGQLTRVEFGGQGAAFYLHDFTLVLFLFSSFVYFFAFKRKFLLPRGAIFVLIFIIVAFGSQINSLRFFSFNQILVGNLFLLRFVGFFALYLIFVNLVSKKQLGFWSGNLVFIGVILGILGFFQLIFLPDLTFLQSAGYDPHVGRLVSTFLDPNFFGGFQVLILNLAFARFLDKGEKLLVIPIAIIFASVILTFSRSSYLALAVSVFLFGILKSKKLAFGVFSVFLLLTPVIPRILERILGALTLDITAQARVESWLQAVKIFSASPVLGVGFNNLRFAKEKFGLFEISQGLGGHAGAGIDSAFLQILSTTGILGFLAFASFYLYFTFSSFCNRKVNFYSLATFVSLTAVFFHTQFVNSLFFPWIASLLWITIAMSDVSKLAQK